MRPLKNLLHYAKKHIHEATKGILHFPDGGYPLGAKGGEEMALALFEHNAKAYQAAAAMLSQYGKAAVVHPTGTGKIYIAF